MRFKSDPGRVLTDAKTHRVIGKFNEDGIFETEDPYYIERLKLLFPVVGTEDDRPDAPKKGKGPKSAQKNAGSAAALAVDENRRFSSDTVTEKSEDFLKQRKGLRS